MAGSTGRMSEGMWRRLDFYFVARAMGAGSRPKKEVSAVGAKYLLQNGWEIYKVLPNGRFVMIDWNLFLTEEERMKIEIELNEKEEAVLKVLAEEMDSTPERMMVRALRIYQLVDRKTKEDSTFRVWLHSGEI